jgi:hypothetical protein
MNVLGRNDRFATFRGRSVIKVEVILVVELAVVLGILFVARGRVVVKGVSRRNGLTFGALCSQY